jgi:hypothetical protein
METLVGFIEEGLIGSIGLSEVAPATLRRASAVHPVAAVQSEYSLWSRQPELGLIEACAELGTTFVAFSPLGRGVFADRFPDHGLSHRAISGRSIHGSSSRTTAPTRPPLRRFRTGAARGAGRHPAVAVAWTLHQGDHVLPIPGTRSAGHPGAGAGRRDRPDATTIWRRSRRSCPPGSPMARAMPMRNGAAWSSTARPTLSGSRMPPPPARSAGVGRSRPRSRPRRGRRRSTRCWFRNRPRVTAAGRSSSPAGAP